MNKPWSYHTLIDLRNCNPEKVRSAEAIRRYVTELCELIEMRRYGETVIIYFGEEERVAGYSMTQLIETSLIAGHFVDATNNIYLDIHSCKYYDAEKAVWFSAQFFEAERYTYQVVERQ